jgi:sugar/nucleoside kinase (ribokinase family)
MHGPDVDPGDHHGGGDSTTRALATALARGEPCDAALRLAMAAQRCHAIGTGALTER